MRTMTVALGVGISWVFELVLVLFAWQDEP